MFEILQPSLIRGTEYSPISGRNRATKTREDQSEMYCKARKYFRFRVIFVAFLLISPSGSSAPKQDSASSLPGLVQCTAIASALIKDPNGFLQNPQNGAIVQKCIKSIPDILEVIKHATGQSLGAGLLVVSGYLLYESYQLYERAKDLEENHEKYQDDFKLVEDEYAIINEYIKKDVLPHWKNGNTAKMVRNLETVIEKLINFFNRLNELADHIRKDIKQGRGDKTRSFGYGVGGVIVCLTSLYTENPVVIIPTCILGFCTVMYNISSFVSHEEILEKCQLLKRAIMKKRKEINKARASLEVVKMGVDINK